MKLPFGKRRLAVIGALGAVVAATLLVVLPALAATTSNFAGAISGNGTHPTYVASGGANDCGLFTAQGATAVGPDQYFVSNPKAVSGKAQTVTDANGVTVTFTVTVDKAYTHLDFSVSGAVVTDVGIKGGNGTDWYTYESNPGGGVTHDTGLTAPSQTTANQPPFYGLSQTVFCYTPKITCQPGVALSDPQHPGETIELPSCAGKGDVFFDFDSSVSGGKNYVSVYAHGGSGTPNMPMVERITGTLTGSTQPTLQYSDTDPAGTLHDMRYCQVDPRAGGSDPLALASQYQDISSKSSVLQPNDPSDPENTSCLISARTWVDTGGALHYEAYVYTDIDGQRVF